MVWIASFYIDSKTFFRLNGLDIGLDFLSSRNLFPAIECNKLWRDYISTGQLILQNMSRGCGIDSPITDSLLVCWDYSSYGIINHLSIVPINPTGPKRTLWGVLSYSYTDSKFSLWVIYTPTSYAFDLKFFKSRASKLSHNLQNPVEMNWNVTSRCNYSKSSFSNTQIYWHIKTAFRLTTSKFQIHAKIQNYRGIHTAAIVSEAKAVYITHLSSATNAQIRRRASETVTGFVDFAVLPISSESPKFHQLPPGNSGRIERTHLLQLSTNLVCLSPPSFSPGFGTFDANESSVDAELVT